MAAVTRRYRTQKIGSACVLQGYLKARVFLSFSQLKLKLGMNICLWNKFVLLSISVRTDIKVRNMKIFRFSLFKIIVELFDTWTYFLRTWVFSLSVQTYRRRSRSLPVLLEAEVVKALFFALVRGRGVPTHAV